MDIREELNGTRPRWPIPKVASQSVSESSVVPTKAQVLMGGNTSLVRQGPRAITGRLLGRVDRLGLADSLIRVAAKTSTNALPRRMAGLGLELSKIAVGKSTIAPEPSDRRFANRAWTENPAFRRIGQSYLAWSKTTLDLVEDAHLDWRTSERARLAASLLTSTLAPTNLLPLNPDAVIRAYESGGKSIVAGVANIGRDIRTNHGLPRTADPDAFQVGRNLAVTPGSVVFRNDVCELLQYAPMTGAVRATPMVLVPPQINKYYFMDLAPGRSFVEYAVRQGLQMFLVSWRNPTVEHRDWNLDTYVAGVKEALHAVTEITGSPQVNTVALCAGGITTAGLLGHLAATQESLINAATFAVTLLDFSVPTMIGLFGSQPIIATPSSKLAVAAYCRPTSPPRCSACCDPTTSSGTTGSAPTSWVIARPHSTSSRGTPTPPGWPRGSTPTSSTCSPTTRWLGARSPCSVARWI